MSRLEYSPQREQDRRDLQDLIDDIEHGIDFTSKHPGIAVLRRLLAVCEEREDKS